MAKRVFLFIATNLLIMVTVSIAFLLLSFTPLGPMIARTGANPAGLAIFCAIYGMTVAFISLAISRMVAKWAMGVEVINPDQPGQYGALV